MANQTISNLLELLGRACASVLDITVPGWETYTAAMMAEPGELRAAARGWRSAAKEVDLVDDDLKNSVRTLSTGWRGEAFEAFDEHTTKVSRQFGELGVAMEEVGNNLDQIAADMEALQEHTAKGLSSLLRFVLSLGLMTVVPGGKAAARAQLTEQSANLVGDIVTMLTEIGRGHLAFNDIKNATEFSLPDIGEAGKAITKAVPEGNWGPVAKVTGDTSDDDTGTTTTTSGGTGGTGGGVPQVPEQPMSISKEGHDPKPPGGFPGGGYTQGEWDPLPSGYGWVSPDAPIPAGWNVDAETHQLLAPGAEPAGEPPASLLPGYTWIAPGTVLPEGWHIDPHTDVLVPPEDLAERAGGPALPADPEARQAWAFDRDEDTATAQLAEGGAGSEETAAAASGDLQQAPEGPAEGGTGTTHPGPYGPPPRWSQAPPAPPRS